MALTPQEQEVAFQRQALENGTAVLENLRAELATAQAAGDTPAVIAEIQQRVDNQERTNGYTLESYNDAVVKATQAANDATVNDAEAAAQTVTPASTPGVQAFDDGSTLQTFDDGSTLATAPDGTVSSSPAPADTGTTTDSPTNPFDDPNKGTDAIEAGATNGSTTSAETTPSRSLSATPANPQPATAQWAEAKDLRVKLRVPNEYLTGKAAGPSNILQKNGGILFPYTPQITVENTANYANQNPLHSNYPLYFYKNSSISPINVTAKFTVQTEFEGAVLLGIIHMLRALTKMKFGNDPDAGAPPPVCRFDAYGDYMLYNVPVSIASWRHELPDNVDYISVGRKGSPMTYGHSMVPVLSTIQLTLNPMYSRREMLAHNTKDWLSGGLEHRGYL